MSSPRLFSLGSSALVVCALLLVAPASADEGGAAGPGPFYTWTGEVPDEPGVLLRQEPLGSPFLLENARAGARILYSSDDFRGVPAVVSGTVHVPKGDAPEGGWPVIAWSHGTVGVADVCAPSATGPSPRDASYLNYWLGRGHAIVATDYEGLGTPGPHPYLHCKSEALGNIDAVNAARNLGWSLSKKWLVAGQSQGGHGALCTGAYATGRAPGLEFVGTLATAPGLSFLEAYSGDHVEADGPMRYLGVVLLNIRGMETFTPTFSAEKALMDKARAMLHRVDEACVLELLEEGARLGLTTSTTFTTVPFSETQGVKDAVVHMEVPRRGWDRPILIGQGTADTMTPFHLTSAYVAELCASGVDVTYLVYEGEEHSGPMNVGRADFAEWVAARFAGKPPTNNCAGIDVRPPSLPEDATPRRR